MELTSPLTNSSNINPKKKIKSCFFINEWKKSNIDVSRFFKNLDEIYLYECLDSGYKFYYPFNLEGDDNLYRELQKFPWYYMDWKWEYQKAFDIITPDEKVLEIGCGKGDFIGKLKLSKGNEVDGLEFNSEAIKKCHEKGLMNVYRETIQDYANSHQEEYDVVCSFQVMEHIAQIGETIKTSLKVLKKNGKFIISVPNNDSFIRKDTKGILNMPPHHMGLWGEKSLKSLERIFNIKLENIYFEPLQSYHYRYYYNIMFGQRIEKIFGKYSGFINKILGRISLHYLTKPYYPKKIKGHAIMAVYTKL